MVVGQHAICDYAIMRLCDRREAGISNKEKLKSGLKQTLELPSRPQNHLIQEKMATTSIKISSDPMVEFINH